MQGKQNWFWKSEWNSNLPFQIFWPSSKLDCISVMWHLFKGVGIWSLYSLCRSSPCSQLPQPSTTSPGQQSPGHAQDSSDTEMQPSHGSQPAAAFPRKQNTEMNCGGKATLDQPRALKWKSFDSAEMFHFHWRKWSMQTWSDWNALYSSKQN